MTDIGVGREQRRRILLRDLGVCGICHGALDHWLGKATSIDHITPRAYGGSHADDNLRAAHTRCNARRGAMQKHKPRAPHARPSRFD